MTLIRILLVVLLRLSLCILLYFVGSWLLFVVRQARITVRLDSRERGK